MAPDHPGRTAPVRLGRGLVYAGDGRFRYDEDTLNMAHVLEDLDAHRLAPARGLNMPPAQPNRDFSIPGA